MRVRLAHLREKHEEDGFAKLSNSLALKIPSSIHTMLQNCPTDNHLEAFGRAIINSAQRHPVKPITLAHSIEAVRPSSRDTVGSNPTSLARSAEKITRVP